MNEQLIFEQVLYLKFKIKQPIRLIELFAGIGAQAKALERLGCEFEHFRVVEYDKFAIKSYNAIHTQQGGGRNIKIIKKERIRKLTPKECFRLMDFDDDDYKKCALVNSDCQLYKQAGNSIVVSVLEAIFKEMI